jgi:hypothetical protein
MMLIVNIVWSKNIYVATKGNDKDGDGSRDNPYKTIQKGIDVAEDGDTVLIAIGTYTGVGNKDLDFKGKAIDVIWVKLSDKTDKNSFFIISALKTVSGKSPDDEFFDINLKFQYRDYNPILGQKIKRIKTRGLKYIVNPILTIIVNPILSKKLSIFSLAGIDVALSKKSPEGDTKPPEGNAESPEGDSEPSEGNTEPPGDTESSNDTESSEDDTKHQPSETSELSEAGLSLNVGFTTYHQASRQIFGGLQLKVFDTIPYWGYHLGSIELIHIWIFT